VQESHDGKLHFIHRTFAEYYVADCLVNRLIEWNNLTKQMQDSILRVVFLEEQYRVIRAFIDGLLSRSKMALKECGNRIHDKRIYDDKILYQATFERNVNIILFLLESVNSDHTDTGNKLLLKKDEGWLRACQIAVEYNDTQILEKLWEWAEMKRTTEGINNKLLLGTDNKGKTIWEAAEKWGKSYTLRKTLEWVNEKLTTEEINNKLLLGTDNKGRTVWHVAAQRSLSEKLQKLWDWANEKVTK
jgi:hypothetical protein